MIRSDKRLAALLVGLTIASAGVAAEELSAATFTEVVDDSGAIALPQGFRERWAHLGSWVVAAESAPGHGFHDVYTQPAAAAAFRRDGAFPDGAVLVKEIRGLGRGALTTGAALWAREPRVWFVMVRDARGRFPGHPDWGEGWGWALFEAAAPAREISRSFAEDCRGCHLPARETGWVYVDGYPSLQPAAGAASKHVNTLEDPQ